MTSSFSEPKELPRSMPSSMPVVGEGLYTGSPYINPALLCAPTGHSTLEATVGDTRGRTAFHAGNEISLPSHFHYPYAKMEPFLARVQSTPQPNFPTYEVSIAR